MQVVECTGKKSHSFLHHETLRDNAPSIAFADYIHIMPNLCPGPSLGRSTPAWWYSSQHRLSHAVRSPALPRLGGSAWQLGGAAVPQDGHMPTPMSAPYSTCTESDTLTLFTLITATVGRRIKIPTAPFAPSPSACGILGVEQRPVAWLLLSPPARPSQ